MAARRLSLDVTACMADGVGNHLVGIHIDRGTCTALHHVNGEMLVPPA